MEEGVDPVLRRARRLKASNNRICDQLVENLELDLQYYIRTVFAALKAPTTAHCGRLGETVYVAVYSISDGLKAFVETVKGFHGPSASGS